MSGFEDVSAPFQTDALDADEQMRAAAFSEVKRLSRTFGNLTSKHLAAGFQYNGQRIPFINPQRGIFKPRRMTHLLSIRTVFVSSGRKAWYEDQRNVHRQVFSGEEFVDYDFMGTDPDAAENRWLKDAYERQTPVIYFLGTAPGLCQAIVPTFIAGFDPRALKAKLAFATSDVATTTPRTAVERRYALRTVKQRLHQASFREMVISAYRGRCAISGLPEPRLLDAAHISGDSDETYGQPIVSNGIPLSKIHHAAFDAHLIGIDPDGRIHISEKLLSLRDGPTLEALRQFHGRNLRPPRREADSPDKERLAARFEIFRASA